MAFFWRVAVSRTGVPLIAVSALAFLPRRKNNDELTLCDAATAVSPEQRQAKDDFKSTISKPVVGTDEGMHPDVEGDYYGHFPRRQLWVPALEYPLWNKDWDGRHPASTGDPEEDHRIQRRMRKTGVTRHIILVRHGQYDETHKVRTVAET